jgi:hypothetical protein
MRPDIGVSIAGAIHPRWLFFRKGHWVVNAALPDQTTFADSAPIRQTGRRKILGVASTGAIDTVFQAMAAADTTERRDIV